MVLCSLLQPCAVRNSNKAIRWWQQHLKPLAMRCHRRKLSTSNKGTYYDSQSGMNVPVHDENEVSIFICDPSLFSRYTDGTAAERWLERLKRMQTDYVGMAGVVLDSADSGASYCKHLLELSESLVSSSARNHLTLFATSQNMVDARPPFPKNVNLMFDYQDETKDDLETRLSVQVSHDIRTSIRLTDSANYQGDSVLVASDIASIMDATGGGDLIWLTPATDNDNASEDDIVELCEELAYLDVTGPTIKSRLVVAAVTEDQVEECLFMGVNKFAIPGVDGTSQEYEWLGNIVKNQGKHFFS